VTYPRTLLLLSLFVSSTALAAPTITSVTPNRGPLEGGTRVTIKGTGFSNNCNICSPPFAAPFVTFGAVRAAEVKFIDANTLEAVTPPSLPRTVFVDVSNGGASGYTFMENAFTFEGNVDDTFEPILFPVFLPPVHGQLGSEFRTFPRVFSVVQASPAVLYGFDSTCYLVDPPIYPFMPYLVDEERMLLTGCSHATGRIFWMRKGTAGSLAAGLRVADISREATSHGTEIPVVRTRDFTTGRIVLLGVPTDPRFRLTLRIYSLAQTSEPVNVEGLGRQVFFTPGRDLYEPSYAEVSDLPRTLTRVVIQSSGAPVWAFITVTNNDTQQITTISPQ